MISTEEREAFEALKAEVATLRELLAQLAVSQVQTVVSCGQIRIRVFDPVMGAGAFDPASSLDAAFQNASAVAEQIVPRRVAGT